MLEQWEKCLEGKSVRLVYPESGDERIQKVARVLRERAWIKEIILIGEGDRLHEKVRWVSPEEIGKDQGVLDALRKKRKFRKMSDEDLRESLRDPLFSSHALILAGQADAGVGGCVYSTPDVIRSAHWVIGLMEGIRRISSSFIMESPHAPSEYKYTLFADAGVIPNPDARLLASIASASVQTWKALFDDEPRVAFLSFSTKGSAEHESLKKIREGTTMFQEQFPEILSEGELQVDSALSPEVLKSKAPGARPVAPANILIFPDLNSANIAYKAVQRFGNGMAYGPLLQGIERPFNDLSRGSTVEDIMGVSVITALESVFISKN